MQTFLNGRIELARALASGELQSHPADVGLIATAVLSACSAICWPDRGSDKKRFIELLVSRSHSEFHANWVSVPALLNDGLVQVENTLYGSDNNTNIFCGAEVDLSLSQAVQQFPTVSEHKLRTYSYAALIYKRLRCGYAHEYWPHETITCVTPSRKAARVSYIGRGPELRRMACFHLEYLLNLAEHHVSSLPSNAISRPAKWWIDGG